MVEKISFNSEYFLRLLGYRFRGWLIEGFLTSGVLGDNQLPEWTPGRFLAAPGLWLGLLFAAVAIAAAIRLRRYRGPF
jgi:hypothetical protein